MTQALLFEEGHVFFVSVTGIYLVKIFFYLIFKYERISVGLRTVVMQENSSYMVRISIFLTAMESKKIY